MSTEIRTVPISIHAAREGGDVSKVFAVEFADISIHAAREGGDGFGRSQRAGVQDFNPRRP